VKLGLFCTNCGATLTDDYHRCNIARTEPSRDPFGLMLQGLAVWHLLLAPIALVILVLLLAGRPENDPPDDFFYFDYVGFIYLAGALIAIAALVTGFVMAGVSFARLGKSFFHPKWRVTLLSGLAGTLATILIVALTVWFMTIFTWPIAEVTGGFLAYHLVGWRLSHSSGTVPA